jgi:hypothetical protein
MTEIIVGIFLFVYVALSHDLWFIATGTAYIFVGLALVIGHTKKIWWMYIPNLIYVVSFLGS